MIKNVLLISEKTIKENSNLSDNVFPKYIFPAVKDAQEMGLQTIIGECLYKRILEMVDDDSIKDSENAAYKELLDDYIQDYLVYEVLKQIVPTLNVKMANIGTVTTGDERIINLTQAEADLLKHNFQFKANFYRRKLQYYLKNNYDAFPELRECTCNCCYTIKPNLNTLENYGLWTGGK